MKSAMLSRGFALAACIAAPFAAAPFAAAEQAPQAGATAFVDVNVIPMDSERVLAGHTVVVRGDRIVAVGPVADVDVPDGARRIDGAGRYLMPGLSEMHGHTPGGFPTDTFREQVMFLYAANGVTTVRGMLGLPGDLELKAKTNTGEIWGPTLYLAGPSFNGNSVTSPSQAADRVWVQKEEGWDHLKIHPGLTVPEYDALSPRPPRRPASASEATSRPMSGSGTPSSWDRKPSTTSTATWRRREASAAPWTRPEWRNCSR